MGTIKDILIESMNGFSPKNIPIMLFQLVMAALLAWVIQKIINKKAGENAVSSGPVIAASVALIVGIAKYSLPFAVLAAAVLIVLGMKTELKSKASVLGFFLIVLVGIACGVGSIVQATIGIIFISTVILLTPLKPE